VCEVAKNEIYNRETTPDVNARSPHRIVGKKRTFDATEKRRRVKDETATIRSMVFDDAASLHVDARAKDGETASFFRGKVPK
jgi:hypothetical protein